MKAPPTLAPWKAARLQLTGVLALLGAPSAGAADYPTTILADNPVAYYRLEEMSGETAFDSSPNHFDATYTPNGNGSSPKMGLPGIDTNSISFSGGADFGYVSIPFHPELSPTSEDGVHGAPFSVECWVQAKIQPADYSVPLAMFGPYEAGAPYANASGWNFYQSIPSAGKSYWIFNHKNAAFHTAGTPITLLKWYHLAGTFDGSNSVFYVNGLVAASQGGITGYLADHNADGQIGAGQITGFLPFNGGVDEIAFYTNALTGSQILAHYQVGTNSFRAPPTPPAILQAPASATNYSGTTVTFSALIGGTPPPALQWYRGTNPIAGATDNAYSFTCSYPADNGATFYLAAANSVGFKKSAVATLTVLTNLNIVHDPFGPITRNLGGHAAFRVVTDGALPITYRWFKGATEVPGATNDTLWFSNLQPTDSGDYHAHVSNPFTSIDSGSARLDALARDPAFPTLITQYAKVVLADRPVAYWRLDETSGVGTAYDIAGVFDGTYDATAGSLTLGEVSGIPRDVDTAIGLTAGAVVSIPYALELNPVTGPWSAEAWVKPASIDDVHFRTVLSSMWNSDSGGHLFGWNVYQHVAGVWTLNMYNGTGGGSFTSDFVHNPINTNTWYYMVITDDLTSIHYYVNNALVVTIDRQDFGFVPQGLNGDVAVAGAPTVLGQRSDNAFDPFDGTIDDVAFYNYSLTPDQIQAHYLNTTKLSAAQSGSQLVLSWPVGTLLQCDTARGTYTPVAGAISPYTNSPSGSEMYFQIQVQ